MDEQQTKAGVLYDLDTMISVLEFESGNYVAYNRDVYNLGFFYGTKNEAESFGIIFN